MSRNKIYVRKSGKRFLAIMLSAVMSTGLLPAGDFLVVQAEAAELAITEDFEDGNKLGYVRGDATATVVDEGRGGGKALKLTGRGQSWHTYSYNVADYAGMEAEITAYMKTADDKAVCECTYTEQEPTDPENPTHYDWVINKDAESADEWVALSGSFQVPEGATGAIELYFSTGGGTADYLLDDVSITFSGSAGEVTYGENLIQNPDFADADLSAWQAGKGGATISANTAEEPIYDDVKTYATIQNRTNDASGNGECFAQEVTDVVESGKTYAYSFYVMLDEEDYKDAPAEKREVCFGPYSDSVYWGSYSTGVLDTNCIKNGITPGEWVKFEGEFTPSFSDGEKVVIRIIEQGTNYGVDNNSSVRGKFSVTGVSLKEKKVPPKEYHIQEDIPDLYRSLSENGIPYTGVAIPSSALSQDARMQLVMKHFNSITCENEMKPESILGKDAPGVSTTEELTEKLNFKQADQVADYITAYNKANGTDVKMRGHVFVWHSQTPTWFFRENFESDGAYVSKDVMDQRMEWYIKTVAQHFDKKYPGLIYAWDVVNEQASDAGGIRTNGDWYEVYRGSNAYIINAFKYADQYVADDTILFYNDYNECTPTKRNTIVRFLEKIRENISADRKLGAGMQGHHDMATPTAKTIEEAMAAYADVADVVHITELDIKSSVGFDGKDLDAEFTKAAYRYKEIYDVVKKVNAQEHKGYVQNITIWGTHDAASWLKTSNSVGGSADGKTPQYPLLFDDDLQAKPAYWALVDDSKLEPMIQNTAAMQVEDYKLANAYAFTAGDADVTIRPVWNEKGVKLQISVKDSAVGTSDALTVYADTACTKGEGYNAYKKTVKASDAVKTSSGYQAEVEIPAQLKPRDQILFDVVLDKGDATYAFNDMTYNQENSSKYFAKMEMKPFLSIQKGTAAIDADASEWKDVPAVSLDVKSSESMEASATAKALWDENNLYIWMDVTDPTLDKTSKNAHEQDSVEIFIDELNEKAGSYDENDKQYRVNFDNEQSFNGTTCTKENIVSKTKTTENGYVLEAAIKWTALQAKEGNLIGIDLQINDGKDGSRIGTANWFDASGNGWSNPGVFGTAVLAKAQETVVGDNTETENKEKAAAVEKLIKEIGTVSYTDASKAKIEAARKAYDALNDAQKALVNASVLKVLTDAETKYETEKKAAEESGKSSGTETSPAPAKKGTKLTDTASAAYYKVTSDNAKNPTVTYTGPKNKKAKTVKIPATIKKNGVTYQVTAIADKACKNNKKITKVVIGKNIKTIGKEAFRGCTKLKTVTMGANVKKIGDKSFYKCTALTKITIPASVTTIGKYAFYGCKKLGTITIKTTKLTTKRVGKQAFKGVKSNVRVITPKKKYTTYKKLLKARGVSAKAKFIKNNK